MGTGKGTGKSMRTRLSKLPFSNLPLSFLRKSVFKGKLFAYSRILDLQLRSSSPATGVIWALRAQSSKNNPKCVPRASPPRGSKKSKRAYQKRVQKEKKQSILDCFLTFLRLFRPRGREAPGTHFRPFFDFGPEGPKWPL